MVSWLIRRFIPQSTNVHDAGVRSAYGVLSGVMGVLLNLILFAVKLPIGLMMRSIAVTSDAFNNLSDMGSSLVTVLGARLSLRRPDREHPFGHGRIEYVAALIVSILILLVGVELLKASAEKFFAPETVALDPVMLAVLALSMAVKGWMFFYNRRISVLIDSPVLRAAASDSLSDVWTTGAVVLSSIVGAFVAWPIDAIAGGAVSLLILWTGFGVAKDTIDQLLGGKPDPALHSAIERMVLDGQGIVGVHDLILHDYGPGRVMASIHAEVPADIDIMRVHEWIDAIEQKVHHELGVPLVIHMDPVVLGSARLDAIRAQVGEVVHAVDARFTFHDLRMTEGEHRINLIFDLVVPVEMTEAARADAVRQVAERLKALDARYCAVIAVDEG